MRANTLFTIFYIAVFMFVAKPFIGFSLAELGRHTVEANSLLVKSFAERRPEDLHDAKAKASSLQQMLINPPLLLLTFAMLLGFLFPLVFKRALLSQSNAYLNGLQLSLIPPAQPYLLAGKLII